MREAQRSGGKVHFIYVVPSGGDLAAARACLERLGARSTALGGRSFAATLTAARLPELRGCRDITSAFVLEPAEKLTLSLKEIDAGRGRLVVSFFPDATEAEIDAALARVGARRLAPTFMQSVSIDLAPDRLPALAEDNAVMSIEFDSPPSIAH